MKMITPEFFTRLLINLKPVKPEHARQKLNPQTGLKRIHLPITQGPKTFRKTYAFAHTLSCNPRGTCSALQALQEDMERKNTAITNAKEGFTSLTEELDKILYDPETGIVNTGNKVKDYIKQSLGAGSIEYG